MKIRVAVLFGGRSVENEISVITAVQAIKAMDAEKYEIIPVYIAKDGNWYSGSELLEVANYKNLPALLKKVEKVCLHSVYGDHKLYRVEKGLFQNPVVSEIDVVLPALHGTNCEDGTLQGVLEVTGLPYAGCNTLASANGMDKITMKMILQACGLPVVDYVWFSDKQWYADKDAVIASVEDKLGYPVIVKPANSGSSVGIGTAHDREELIAAIKEAESYTQRIIVEKLVSRLKEVNCAVLGDYYDCEPSPCEVPMRSGEILSYADKYKSGGNKGGAKGMHSVKRELPARLPEGVTEQIQQMAVETFRALACDGVARIDFMIDESDGRVYVNEINTIPGSLSFYLWECAGIGFTKLIDRMIDLAFARQRAAVLKTVEFGDNILATMDTNSFGKAGKTGKL